MSKIIKKVKEIELSDLSRKEKLEALNKLGTDAILNGTYLDIEKITQVQCDLFCPEDMRIHNVVKD